MNKFSHFTLPILALSMSAAPFAVPAHAASQPASQLSATWSRGNTMQTVISSTVLTEKQVGKPATISFTSSKESKPTCTSAGLQLRPLGAAATTVTKGSYSLTCVGTSVSVRLPVVSKAMLGKQLQLAVPVVVYPRAKSATVSSAVTLATGQTSMRQTVKRPAVKPVQAAAVATAAVATPKATAAVATPKATAAVATTAAPQAPAVPEVAKAAGFTRPVFSDDFSTRDSIDLAASGTVDKSWYTDLPWGGSRTPSEKLVKTANGLQIDQAVTNQNVALLSMSPRTGKGQTFGHGYFEARMRFDPAGGKQKAGFPAFWLLPKTEMYQQTTSLAHGEIDIFEAYRTGTAVWERTFAGTAHDIKPLPGEWQYTGEQNANNVVPAQIDGNWHTYSALWEKGRIRWFMDGKQMVDVAYGPDRHSSAPTVNWQTGERNTHGVFSQLDADANTGMVMMLGTAPDWPVEVDHVRVWSK